MLPSVFSGYSKHFVNRMPRKERVHLLSTSSDLISKKDWLIFL